MSSSTVLLVRPAGDATSRLVEGLEARGFVVTTVSAPHEALAELAARQYPIVLLELSAARHRTVAIPPRGQSVDLPPAPISERLDAMRRIRQISPITQIVAMAGSKLDLTTCCQAVAYGAVSIVEWRDGGSIDALVDRLQQAMARHDVLVAESHQRSTEDIFDETGVAGRSEAMARLLFKARRAAMISDVPVLISGESGTGKQLLAEAIHRMDPKRGDRPFLTVNCAAITGSLAESALFGHRKGAFTGATEHRLGYFQAAEGGTVFLDEISEMEKTLQPKLLRVLQERKVLPVGADTEREVDVRVIAACNRPLEALVETGEFRLDLYQRLNVITLTVPPLRERAEDVPLLVQYFLKRYANDYPHPIESVDERVYEVLARSIGSGNVRELENAVRQILVFKQAGTRIELSDIPPDLLRRLGKRHDDNRLDESLSVAVDTLLSTQQATLPDLLDRLEGMILREALARSAGTHSELAERLGLSRRTLYNKLGKHELG